MMLAHAKALKLNELFCTIFNLSFKFPTEFYFIRNFQNKFIISIIIL